MSTIAAIVFLVVGITFLAWRLIVRLAREYKASKVVKVDNLCVDLSLSNWKESLRDNTHSVWLNDDRDSLKISLGHGHPNLGFSPLDMEAGRDFMRRVTTEIGQGFVELTPVRIDGVDAARHIVKIRQNPSGISYLGSICLPFMNCMWMVTVVCKEYGVTGIREAIVLAEKFQAGEVRADHANGKMIGWARDPYDESIEPDFGYELSDDPKYDAKFPQHPLSRLRRILAYLEDTIHFDRSGWDATPYVHSQQPTAIKNVTIN